MNLNKLTNSRSFIDLIEDYFDSIYNQSLDFSISKKFVLNDKIYSKASDIFIENIGKPSKKNNHWGCVTDSKDYSSSSYIDSVYTSLIKYIYKTIAYETYNYLKKKRFIRVFYKKYMKKYVNIAKNSYSFNYVSPDVMIKILEASITEFIHNEDSTYSKDKRKIYTHVCSKLKRYVYANNAYINNDYTARCDVNLYDIVHGGINVYDHNIIDIHGFKDFIYDFIFDSAIYNSIIQLVLDSIDKEGWRTISDVNFHYLKAEMKMYFIKNVSIIVANHNIISDLINSTKKFAELLETTITNIYTDFEKNKDSFVEFIDKYLENLEVIKMYCFQNQKKEGDKYTVNLQTTINFIKLVEELRANAAKSDIEGVKNSISIIVSNNFMLTDFFKEEDRYLRNTIENKSNFSLYEFMKSYISDYIEKRKFNCALVCTFNSNIK